MEEWPGAGANGCNAKIGAALINGIKIDATGMTA